MSEASPYINTFALITFEFENPKDSVKYEYFLENLNNSNDTRPVIEIPVTPNNNDQDEPTDDESTSVWIVQELQDNDTYEFKIKRIDVSEYIESASERLWIGPFEDEMIAKLYLDAWLAGN